MQQPAHMRSVSGESAFLPRQLQNLPGDELGQIDFAEPGVVACGGQLPASVIEQAYARNQHRMEVCIQRTEILRKSAAGVERFSAACEEREDQAFNRRNNAGMVVFIDDSGNIAVAV
ncbi:hypothetical protein D3C81_1821720 [compost metagenome]